MNPCGFHLYSPRVMNDVLRIGYHSTRFPASSIGQPPYLFHFAGTTNLMAIIFIKSYGLVHQSGRILFVLHRWSNCWHTLAITDRSEHQLWGATIDSTHESGIAQGQSPLGTHTFCSQFVVCAKMPSRFVCIRFAVESRMRKTGC